MRPEFLLGAFLVYGHMILLDVMEIVLKENGYVTLLTNSYEELYIIAEKKSRK